MRKEKFMIDGKMYSRITKNQARKLFEKGDNIALLPSKIVGLEPTIVYKGLKCKDWDFNDYVNNFVYFLCNCECGKYPKFFKVGGN